MVAIFLKVRQDYQITIIKDLYGYSSKDFIKELKKFNVEKQAHLLNLLKLKHLECTQKKLVLTELKEPPQENLFHIINLDINLLHYYLLEPTLGIGDPRYDNRIDFLARFHGLEEIENKVNSGEAKIGFSLYATQMENVISC